MSPTLPFAGTSVPAEGVLHFVAAMLKSPSLEDGLRGVLEAIIDDRAIEAGLWVWPEPAVIAIGLIGSARLFEVHQHELASVPPPDDVLIEWTARVLSGPALTVIPLGTVGAICLPASTPGLSSDEQLWYATWLEWLAGREIQLRDAKLKSLAEFAAGAGHEINNPLGTILGRSQLLLRQEADPERRRWLAAIGGQALRIRDMISDTMVFARPPAPQLREVELEPLIHSVTDRFAEELDLSQITLQLNLSDRPPANAPSPLLLLDSEQFQVALIELLRNAIRAAGMGGRIGLRTRTRSWQGKEWLEVDISNNGPELTPAEREHLFDPFFSGRDAGRGLGFGLTKCWRIVNAHGGRIGVHSTPERTVFRSLWPIRTTEAE